MYLSPVAQTAVKLGPLHDTRGFSVFARCGVSSGDQCSSVYRGPCLIRIAFPNLSCIVKTKSLVGHFLQLCEVSKWAYLNCTGMTVTSAHTRYTYSVCCCFDESDLKCFFFLFVAFADSRTVCMIARFLHNQENFWSWGPCIKNCNFTHFAVSSSKALAWHAGFLSCTFLLTVCLLFQNPKFVLVTILCASSFRLSWSFSTLTLDAALPEEQNGWNQPVPLGWLHCLLWHHGHFLGYRSIPCFYW